jgi:hypothetical protein
MRLTDAELMKLHLHGHAPARRILKFLTFAIPEEYRENAMVKLSLKEIERRLLSIVLKCKSCLRTKKPSEGNLKKITNFRISEGFNQDIELDVLHIHASELESLIPSARVLTCTCKGSGFTRFMFLPDGATSQCVASTFYLQWVLVFGVPSHVCWGDLGPEFVGNEFLELCESLGVVRLVGAPRSPQSHGTIEVRNRFARQALRKISSHLGIELSDLPLILGVIENDYNNSTIRNFYGKTTFPSLRVFGQSTSALRNIFTDTPASATSTCEMVRLAEEARRIWREMTCSKKLREALSQRAPSVNYVDFTVGQMVYYHDTSVGRKWRGPAVVVGTNVVSKYLVLDHAGILVHAHFLHVRPAHDADYLRDQIDNSLTPSKIGVSEENSEFYEISEPKSDLPKFASNFDASADPRFPQHMVGRASAGASRFRQSSAPASKRAVGSGKTSARRAASARGDRPGGTPTPLVSKPTVLSDCPGCSNNHKMHISSCPRSLVAKRRNREKNVEQVADVRPRASSVPIVSGKEKTTQVHAGKHASKIASYFADTSNVTVANVVTFEKGDKVRFFDDVLDAKIVATVHHVTETTATVTPEGGKPPRRVDISNLTKLRTVRDKNGNLFGSLPDPDTSTTNARKLVESRQKALLKQALVGEARPLAENLCGGRPMSTVDINCLFEERTSHNLPEESDYSDCDSTCSGYSNSSQVSNILSVVSVASPTSPDDTFVCCDGHVELHISSESSSSSAELPRRPFLQAHEASDIDFAQLPRKMQISAYFEALKDFDNGKCWKPAGTLKEWKKFRSDNKENVNQKVVIMDAVWVEKAIVDEGSDTPHQDFGLLKGKVRLAPRGFREKGVSRSEVASPTVSPVTLRIVETICLQLQEANNLVPIKMDFKRAFFQIGMPLANDKKIGLVLPRECQGERRGDDRIVMELLKEVPGTKGAPRDWFLTISTVFKAIGFSQSRIDPCLFFNFKNGKLVGVLCLHVDDSRGWLDRSLVTWLKESLAENKIQTRYVQVIESGIPTDMVGLTWLTNERGTYLNQQNYVNTKLKPIDLVSFPDHAKQFSKSGSIAPNGAGSRLYRKFRKRLGQLIWLEKTRIEFSFDVSILASLIKCLSLAEIHYINDIISTVTQTKEQCLFLPRLPPGRIQVHTVMDASLASRVDHSSQGARAVGITVPGSDKFSPVEVSSRRVRRTGSSSFDVELLTLVDSADMSIIVGLVIEELMYNVRPSLAQRIMFEMEGVSCNLQSSKTPIIIDTDAKDSVERIYSLKDSINVSKRRRIDIADMQELLVFNDVTEFRHICGSTNPMDCLTKKYGKFGLSKNKASYKRFLDLLYNGEYLADITAVDRNGALQKQKAVRNCKCFYCAL